MRKTEKADTEITMLSLDDMDDRDETHYGLNGSPTQVQKIFPPETNHHRELWNEEGSILSEKLFQKVKELKFV